jgi:hypothetical protein
MALGKPLVMSDIGGASEQVVHGQTGLLFEPHDIAALTEQLTPSDLPRLGLRWEPPPSAASASSFAADHDERVHRTDGSAAGQRSMRPLTRQSAADMTHEHSRSDGVRVVFRRPHGSRWGRTRGARTPVLRLHLAPQWDFQDHVAQAPRGPQCIRAASATTAASPRNHGRRRILRGKHGGMAPVPRGSRHRLPHARRRCGRRRFSDIHGPFSGAHGPDRTPDAARHRRPRRARPRSTPPGQDPLPAPHCADEDRHAPVRSQRECQAEPVWRDVSASRAHEPVVGPDAEVARRRGRHTTQHHLPAALSRPACRQHPEPRLL